jgi:ABC-type transport system substrate-binding protein
LPDLYAIGTAQAWVTGWSADYPDPDGVFRGFFQTGWPFYSDDEILEKLEQARSLGNQDERMRLYHEIDRIWVTERAGIVPLAYGRTMLLRRPWVHSVWVNPLQRAHLDKVVVKRSESLF